MTKAAFRQADLWLRRLGWLLVGVALAVLSAAYAAMCWEHGTALLWNVPVHEDGHRTLAQTLFYFEHATRELPVDLLLGIIVGAGAARALPAPSASTSRLRPLLVWILLGLLLLITVPTALRLGLGGLRDNLLQYPTREGEPLVWGSHWRYHFLERGSWILLVLGLCGVVRAFRPQAPHGQGKTLWIGIGAFLALTALFTPNFHALSLPFTDTRYLGHQIREIFTHGLVTLPLCVGVLLLYPRQEGDFSTSPGRGLVGSIILIGLAVVLITYVFLAALGGDALSAGQSDSLITLLAPHFFEHGFTYLVTPVTALLVYEKLGALGVRAKRHS